MGLVPASSAMSIASVAAIMFGYVIALAALMVVVGLVQLAIRKATHRKDLDSNATTYISMTYPMH